MPMDITLMLKLAGTTLKNSRIRASCFTSFCKQLQACMPLFCSVQDEIFESGSFLFC